MEMATERYRVTIGTQNRIALPRQICKQLGIKKDSILEFEAYGQNKIFITVLVR